VNYRSFIRESDSSVPRFRLVTLTLFLAVMVGLTLTGTAVHGQSECLQQCQDQHDTCIKNNPDPQVQVACEYQYDTCVEACM